MSWFWTTILNSYLRLIPTPWSYFLLHVHGVFRDGFVVSESDLNLVWKKKDIMCHVRTLPSWTFTRFFFILNILKLCRRGLILTSLIKFDMETNPLRGSALMCNRTLFIKINKETCLHNALPQMILLTASSPKFYVTLEI